MHYQAAPSILAQVQRQWPIKKDGHLGIQCDWVTDKKKKTLVSEQVKLKSRRALTVVV